MAERTPVRSFILVATRQTISPHLDRMSKVPKLDGAARGPPILPPHLDRMSKVGKLDTSAHGSGGPAGIFVHIWKGGQS